MTKRKRTTYSNEFKLQMVELYNNGKPAKEITAEYDLSPASIHNWVRAFRENGTTKSESKLTLSKEIPLKKTSELNNSKWKMIF